MEKKEILDLNLKLIEKQENSIKIKNIKSIPQIIFEEEN